MQRIVVISFILLLCSAKQVMAQVVLTEFSDAAPVFQQQMVDYLNQTKLPEAKEAASEFAKGWPTLDEYEHADIIAISNTMLKRKMEINPYFIDFVRLINVIATQKTAPDIITDWAKSIKNILATSKPGNNSDFETYISFSKGLFSSLNLYTSASHIWKSSSDNYKFKFDKNVPYIEFQDLVLMCITQGDTALIDATSGVYYPLTKKWYGKNGFVTWERAGLDSTFANVHFSKYHIDMNVDGYSVDSVKLNYQPMKGKNVLGRFTDKAVTDNKPATSHYPKFESYSIDMVLDNIDRRVKLYCGLRLEGARMYAYGNRDQKAVLKIYKNDGHTLAVLSSSRSFQVKKFEDIIAENATTSIYIAKDSIYHNGARLNYRISTHDLALTREGDGAGKSPFYSSYHKSEIVTEQLKWNIDDDELDMKNVQAAKTQISTLTSENEYDENTFYKFQTSTDILPISVLKFYCDRTGSRDHPISDIATEMNSHYTSESIVRLIYKLVEDGFVDYDEETGMVHVRDKVMYYALSPTHHFDYDIIKLRSKTDSTNFTLNLKNYTFDVKGVYSVPLSDSNFVMFFPVGKHLVYGKNREMRFDGTIFAGRNDLFAEGAVFSYPTFDIDMTKIKSYQINLPTGGLNKDGTEEVVPIKSQISDLKGILKIDDPHNKSHARAIPEFPKLIATEGGRIYYDDKHIAGGAYTRDKFYFELKPFEMDSLNSFRPSRVQFDGKLVSGGILPDIDNTVRIQKDYTLGFTTTVPEMSAYGGRGTFKDTITLDQRGLTAQGSIHFLNTTISSRNIHMYIDSTRAFVQSFSAEAATLNGVEFPQVTSSNNPVLWKPYSDSMVVNMTNTPFRLFNAETYLKGNVVLTSKGMRGSGVVDWVDARLLSRDIEFKRNAMDADSSAFMIKAGDSTKFALSTKDVTSHIDFDKRKGYFKSRTDAINTEFPYNLYKTSMDEFTWDMDEKFIDFRSVSGSSTFTSEEKDQDSLSFDGAHATYNLRNYLLQITGVPTIHVADGEIMPDSGVVRIDPDARMRTLTHAKMKCDTVNGYHELYDVTANVYAKHNIQATGWLDFVSADRRKEKIYMSDIHAEKTPGKPIYTLMATGNVADTEKFTLMPKVQFKGKVVMNSPRENLLFQGFAKLDLKNPKAPTRWFSISDEFNQDSSYIYYKDPHNEQKGPMDVGILLNQDSLQLYTCLFDNKRTYFDRGLIDVKGIMYYDATDKLFKFGDPKKILDNENRGNMLTYDDATGAVIGEGKVDFGLKTNMFKVNMGGRITNTVGSHVFKADVVMGCQFPFPKELAEKMAKDINTLGADKDELDNSDETIMRALVELVDPKNEKKFTDEFGKSFTAKQGDYLNYEMLFTKLNFEWDTLRHLFHCRGPLGLAYLGDKQVNKLLDGYAEAAYKRGNDVVRFYFKLGDDDWYYMEYLNNNLNLLSSSDEFNKLIGTLKSSQKNYKSDDSKSHLTIQTTSVKKVKDFVARMKQYEEDEAELKQAQKDKNKALPPPKPKK